MFGIGPKVPQVTVGEVKKSLDNGEKITILDVRTEGEVSRGKIKGSINVPLDDISTILAKIKNKNEKVYVYCLSGSRSSAAVAYLMSQGYANVRDISSGLLAWRAKGFPLV